MATSWRSRPESQKINRAKTNHGKMSWFADGGSTVRGKNLFKGTESYSEELKEARAIKSGKITPEEYAKGEKMEKEKPMKKMAFGGMSASAPRAARATPAAPSAPVRKMASGGFTRSADGIAQRGKTKGTQVKMKKGGRC